MPFLERMVGGEEPFWRPLYLRSFRALGPTASVRVDEVAIEELAVCDSLLAGDPQCVTTVASRCPKSGEVRALFLTVEYGDGRVAQCTVSVAEAANARRLVVAMQDRTVILDDQDRASPVRILGEGEQDLLGERASALDGPAADSVAAEMESFLAAVAAGDLSASNGARWTRVAGLWWAARQSMSFGGPVEVLKGPIRPVRREPPPLRVIEGGGKKTQVAKERPPLTLVAG